MTKYPLPKCVYEKLLQSMESLLVSIEEVKRDIETAKSFGDLSENAAYDYSSNELVVLNDLYEFNARNLAMFYEDTSEELLRNESGLFCTYKYELRNMTQPNQPVILKGESLLVPPITIFIKNSVSITSILGEMLNACSKGVTTIMRKHGNSMVQLKALKITPYSPERIELCDI